MGGYNDGDNNQIGKFNTVQQLQDLLTKLTVGLNPCNVLVTDENNSLNLYITFREGAIKIGSSPNLGDIEAA
jgi:hypothetical protein